MGSATAVLPSAYHQSMLSSGKPVSSGGDATAMLKKRPKMDHGSKGSKRSKLNVKEANSAAAQPAKDAVPANPKKSQALNRGMFLAFIDNALQQRRNVCFNLPFYLDILLTFAAGPERGLQRARSAVSRVVIACRRIDFRYTCPVERYP